MPRFPGFLNVCCCFFVRFWGRKKYSSQHLILQLKIRPKASTFIASLSADFMKNCYFRITKIYVNIKDFPCYDFLSIKFLKKERYFKSDEDILTSIKRGFYMIICISKYEKKFEIW